MRSLFIEDVKFSVADYLNFGKKIKQMLLYNL